jgi:tetratricopeptide (TPR) repeat protein
MKRNSFLKLYVLIVFAGLTVLMPFLSPKTSGVSAQDSNVNNRISGYVFGFQRTPLDRVDVELLDDLNRTVSRTRTNGSGLYVFFGMTQGRYIVRVLPFSTDYEEQEQEVEIININRTSTNPVTGGGRGAISAAENKQQDFYLKLRQGAITGTNAAIFVQEVPKEAKALYDKGLDQLRDNKQKEAFQNIKAAIEKFDKYYYALETLGTEYVRLRYFKEAAALLATAVDINPRGYRSWHGLTYSLFSLGIPDMSLIAGQKMIELNGNSPEALLLYGAVLRQNKKFDEAEKQFIKAKELRLKSYMPEIHRQLAFLYGYDMKRYADAVKELKLYLKARPEGKDNDDIKKRMKEFEEKAQANPS